MILQTSNYVARPSYTVLVWQAIAVAIGLVVILPLIEGLLEGMIEKKEKE